MASETIDKTDRRRDLTQRFGRALGSMTKSIMPRSTDARAAAVSRACPYCGRTYNPHEPRTPDPYGCFGCTSRTLDLSRCAICGSALPISSNGQRYRAASGGECDRCGAPTK